MNFDQLHQQPVALMPEAGGMIFQNGWREAAAVRRNALLQQTPSRGTIAVLSLSGVLSPAGEFGGTSLSSFASEFSAAIRNPEIQSVLICIDSPGGSVYGIQELSQMMQSARSQKPIVAIANSLAASAAYWIGCQASEFYCTPGGEVGSIGVWQAHMDISGMLGNAGIKPTLISAGKFKTEGNPYQPLNPDALAFMQSRVDDYYAAFVDAVASSRGVKSDVVRNGMGQGRVLGASEALNQRMIDGIATLPQVLASLAAQTAINTARRNAATTFHPKILRARLDFEGLPQTRPTSSNPKILRALFELEGPTNSGQSAGKLKRKSK